MNTIVKIFTGKYIDLSKIITISDAYINNGQRPGAYFSEVPTVCFDIECQLLEQPIRFKRKLTTREFDQYMATKAGEYTHLATNNLQKDIDVVVEQWMASKDQQIPQTEG